MKYILFFLIIPFITVGQLPDSLLSIVNYTGIPANSSVRDIVVTKSNIKYVATNLGLYKVTNKISKAELILPGDFSALCTNKKEDVWAVKGNKLISLTEEMYTFDSGTICNSLLYHRGNIWSGTDQGLYKINIKTKRKTGLYTTSNSKMKSDKVNFVFADPQGQMWIGTDKGLCLINSKKKWKVFEKNLSMESMTYNKEGLWLVTNKEMWVIDAFGRWYPAALNKGLKEGQVRDITTDKDGRLILASNVLVRYNPYIDEIHSYTDDLGFLAQQTNAIEGDANQDIWIGTESNGLYFLSFGDTKTLNLSAILSIEQKISCKGSNTGVVKVTAYGGKPPYKYTWHNKKLHGKKLSSIGEGNYKVTVTDRNNNKFETEIFLDNPYPLNLNFKEIKKITAAGAKDGQASLAISGGVPPYSYKWDDGSSQAHNKNLSAGIHSLTLTDADKCSAQVEFEVAAEKFIPQLNLDELEIGQTLKVNHLFFEADSSSITESFEPVLDEIYLFLSSNPSVVIEIGGHTNGFPPKDLCDLLSTKRAKNIAEFLYRKGISSNRISFKGYGKDFPIATNDSLAGRKKNQRVEIKILQI